MCFRNVLSVLSRFRTWLMFFIRVSTSCSDSQFCLVILIFFIQSSRVMIKESTLFKKCLCEISSDISADKSASWDLLDDDICLVTFLMLSMIDAFNSSLCWCNSLMISAKSVTDIAVIATDVSFSSSFWRSNDKKYVDMSLKASSSSMFNDFKRDSRSSVDLSACWL